MKWSRHKEKQFSNDLRALLATYGIAYVMDLSAGEVSGEFQISGHYYYWKPGAHDSADAAEAIHKSLVDVALDTGDREMFERLTSTLCTDCDVKLADEHKHCAGCGKPMCDSCHTEGRGRCVECEYPNQRRYI